MITELAQIDIKPGEAPAFEAAVAEARTAFARAEGFHGLELHRGIEDPGRYWLIVKWATLAHHTVTFRNSAAFAEWRSLAGQYFAATHPWSRIWRPVVLTERPFAAPTPCPAKTRRRHWLTTLAPLLVGGCMAGPDYHRPTPAVPAHFKELPGWKLATPQDAAPKGAWWRAFNDPGLNQLESQVDTGSQTLAEQEAAYRAAQAVVNEARANLYPTITASPGVTRSRTGGSTVATGGTTRTTYSVEGTADWEIDLWGLIRRQIQSDVRLAQASAAEVANARLSAEALLATDYLDLRVQDQLIKLLNDTVDFDRHSLRITQNQYEAGVAARSDVITAQTQLDGAISAAINAGVARATYEHAIAVQIGRAPAELSITPNVAAQQPFIPDIPGLLPAALLERRPDIANAERSMAADNALIGAAVAAYYPTVSLSALFGYSGNPLGSVISAANRVWSLGASASETLFAGGARTAAVALARATYDESVATYRQTVLSALQGVEDQLSTLRILADQAKVQEAAVKDATQAVQIALNEYQAGTQAYTTVVTAENTLITDQQNLLTIRQNRLTAAVALIEDLGGGWSTAQLPDKDALQRSNPLLP
jgi:NodT family efflux transporter outer membrane factor (OMF) lipoprotein